MAQKRIISALLFITMIMSLLPVNIVFAEDNPTWRSVYLHAQGANPKETTALSTVYLGENTDLYFAVDNPNKGKYENGVHLEPQYDMNGYTVKFHFDANYFDYALDSSAPIDYTVPDSNIDESEKDSEEAGGKPVPDVPQTPGYLQMVHGSGEPEFIGGKIYKTAYITVFFSGAYVPQKKDDQLWYNLCKLPLIPLRAGSTEVFIDISNGDKYDLELFAKNVDEDIVNQTFKFDAEYSGRHTITIKNKLKPNPPIANPVSGDYTEKQTVELTAENDCNIYYSIDGGNNYEIYTKPFDVETTTTVLTYAKRKTDDKMSDTVKFVYNILPKMPYLFDANKTRLPNIYNDADDVFDVYVSDKEQYDDIEPDNEVYYTFSDLPVSGITFEGGTNPEKEWVKIPKGYDNQKFQITESCAVRIVTGKLGEFSDVNTYYLGIKPAPVTVVNNPPAPFKDKVDVTLNCETEGAKIYYTTDGSDPRYGGTEYLYPIPLSKDTTLRAVAKLGDVYGEVSSFPYIFEEPSNYAVDAFYPAGVYEGNVLVTLTPYDPHNKIVYSDDGGLTWKDYKEVLDIDTDTTILAKSVDINGKEGDVYTFKYLIKPLPPQFSPETTHFSNSNTVTIFCPETTAENTDRFELWYTVGNTEPADPRDTSKSILVNHPLDTEVVNIDGYTIIKAAVRKDGHAWSEVVTHSYDIVVDKPTKPITTLVPGNYPREIDNTEGFTTGFLPVATSTNIYYTVAYGDDVAVDPDPKDMPVTGTFKYDGTPIKVEGKTVIKAIAVNEHGVKSDIGIFEYLIIPAPPKIPGSAINPNEEYELVPVTVIEGSDVTYIINGNENNIDADEIENGVFYINPNNGNAYSDTECKEEDLIGSEINIPASDKVNLEIWKELHDVQSESSYATFEKTTNINYLNTPEADKASGEYYEINSDGNNNFLLINLSSPYNEGDIIQYTFADPNEGNWIDYDGNAIPVNKNVTNSNNLATLSVRAKKGNYYSAVSSYYYTFRPLPPVITLETGTYTGTQVRQPFIKMDDRAPTNIKYEIYYRANGDTKDYLYQGQKVEIDHSMHFKAYVVNTEKEKNNLSVNTVNSYIIENTSTAGGMVYIPSPYNVKRIASNHLSTGAYAEGIKLVSTNPNAKIHYWYGYTTTDGRGISTNNLIYDNVPIMVNSSMKSITIDAWLEDENGEIPDSDTNFPYIIEFVDLGIPVTSLGYDKVEYPADTPYTLKDYPHKEFDSAILFYTLNGDDPTDPNLSRVAYKGEELKITGPVTVRTVYFLPCGTCRTCKDDDFEHCIEIYNDYCYGSEGTYKYTVPTRAPGGGGGGGGGRNTIDNTRKYTSDIFGNEHPTHIGYINGYPDGSVKPDGNITREEMAAILYRIKNKTYDEPFTTTGEVFPDVEKIRWSATEIEYMTNDEVIVGYPDGEFKPENNLTRAEFAALICRFAKLKEATPKKDVFPDLEEEHWAYMNIHALYAAGLLDGYEDGTYRAENNITRAEVMTVVNKLLGRKPSEPYVKSLHFNPYNDLIETKWYYVIVLEATITHNYYLNAKGVEIKWEDFK